jgi:hypothetical protein
MSKRLTRIAASHLPDELHKFLDRKITAVLNDGKSYFGKLKSFTGTELTITDPRDHLHVLPLSWLYEIVYDKNVAK